MGFLILSYDQTEQRLHLHIYFFNFNLFVVKYFFIKSMVYIIKHSCKCWFYFIIFTAEYTCLSVCSVLLCMYLLFCCLCSKHLLHNKFSNPGRIRPLSNSIRTKFQTLNVTQGHKPSYTTSYTSIPNDGDDSYLFLDSRRCYHFCSKYPTP